MAKKEVEVEASAQQPAKDKAAADPVAAEAAVAEPVAAVKAAPVAAVQAAPVAQVAVQEKLVTVKPRVTKTAFRCNGKHWSTVAGQEMKVPPGVAEHMATIGLL